ncbi:MAG TPA: GNAT family N-acetyltransferase [Rhizomicrobium sp.]|nr:GNAT family N-acetyltransferase [Rhizomicrobium sp.]
MQDFEIRSAREGDEGVVLALLRELAAYEKLLDRFRVTAEIVKRDYLSERPLIFCDLAIARNEEALGLASWHWIYGSFAAAPKLYLADLFVRPEARSRGAGKALIAHLARRALAHGANAVEWEVLDWNKPSIAFYDRLGASPIKGWIGYSLAGEALERLATR